MRETTPTVHTSRPLVDVKKTQDPIPHVSSGRVSKTAQHAIAAVATVSTKW